MKLTYEPPENIQLQELIKNNLILNEQLEILIEKNNESINASKIDVYDILFFIVPYLYSTVSFNLEAKTAKENLYSILKATPTK